jgi:hypothetical protein
VNADVSRALARFIASLSLDRDVAREFAAQFADVQDVTDLPDWVREVDDGDEVPAVADAVRAAAGYDVTPGHDELHHWWVYGEGRARWHTWTELYTQLLEHVPPEKAKLFASKWFLERFHYASGSDLNRVKHGKPPRGNRVGPG